MANETLSKILARQTPEDFIGREAELEALMSPAAAGDAGGCTVLLAAPGVGSSELLKQAFDRFFREQSVMPVYFSIDRADRTAESTARRFLYQICLQAAAFGRRDPRIIKYSPPPEDLDKIARPADAAWMERVITILRRAGPAEEGEYRLASNFGAAVRAAEAGPIVFLIDHLSEADFIEGGEALVRAFDGICGFPNAEFVFSTLRRRRPEFSQYREEQIGPLDRVLSGHIADSQARLAGLRISEQARDLIAAQTGGRIASVISLIRSAAKSGTHLESFRQVQSVYTDELTGGDTARYFDRILRDAAAEPEFQKNIVGILYDLFRGEASNFPAERWERLSGLGERASRALCILNTRELLTVSHGQISAASGDTLLADYIDSRYRLERGSGSRALIVGDSLSNSLKRAPELMAEFYRRSTALGLRELLARFETVEIPAALLDYGKFRDEYKGADDEEVFSRIEHGPDFVSLPQIVQSVYTESIFKPISQFIERERSAVGRGFNGRRYSNEEEIAWIAAEIDSKLEASAELAESWCDRLEAAASACGFARFKIWLVAPEGFTAAALEKLAARGAIGSSRQQIELLRHFLDRGRSPQRNKPGEEYEIVVPMGNETELIAANAVEDIARRHNMDAKSINQIKTALVEACINAAEHGHSPDRKIYQKFAFGDDKITITISNRGVRLADKRRPAGEPSDGRRGWGLDLMRRLMDEVTVEDVDDGTMISMTKYLPKTA